MAGWNVEAPPKSHENRLKMKEVFIEQDLKRPKRHRLHVQAIVRTGQPDPMEEYRPQSRISCEGGCIAVHMGVGGLPVTFGWALCHPPTCSYEHALSMSLECER